MGALYVNNVVGSAVISLCGATVGAASVSCYNEEVQKLETAADKPKILNYDANRYTAAQIEKLGAGFDAVNNVASVYAGAPANGTACQPRILRPLTRRLPGRRRPAARW